MSSAAFFHFFSQGEILPWHTLQGRKGASQGFGCLQHSPSGLEQVKHQGAGHSSLSLNLMGNHFCLSCCFLPKALAAPGRSRLKFEMPQHYSCTRPVCLAQLKDKLVGAELALILAKSSAGILPTTLAVFCPGAGGIQSSFVRNIILKGALGSFKIKDVFSEYKTFIT